PGLASSLVAAEAQYTAVDDAHFVAAGFERDALWGYYLTEDQGRSLAVFPIHRELRYLVPFGEPAETVDLLKRVAEGGAGRIAVLGDDGEKFGVWPGTRERCYDQRWLERFAETLAQEPWIELRPPGEAIAHHAPLGLAYLPTASYHEMEEWSLPPAAQARYHRAEGLLRPAFGESARDVRLWAFDDRIGLWNYGDTLARRAEAYHGRLREAEVGAAQGETIHGAPRLKEAGLAALAEAVDADGRDAFVDRWEEGGTT